MKTRLRKQYYCDHCKKNGAHAGIIRVHEAHCTKNQTRSCRFCHRSDNGLLPKLDYKAIQNELNQMPDNSDLYRGHYTLTDEQMKRLREMVGNCPACILTVLRRMESSHDSFEFSNEKKAWWEIHGKDRNNFVPYCV